jgi:catecholate siderophore receptor
MIVSRRRPTARLGLLLAAGVAGAAVGPGRAVAAEAAEGAAAPIEGAVDYADGASVVSAVVVNGRRDEIAAPTMAGGVKDTPQTIQVIDEEQLRTQGVATLEQALRNVPGITIAIGEGGALNGDQFKIRGFDAKDDVYVDGLRDFGVYQRDSFAYQEVQVLKGPSGAMFGRGTTGGVINTVSKRPTTERATSLDAFVGNGNYYRGLADVNLPLGETSGLRLNLVAQSSDVVDRDVVHTDRWGVAAAYAWGLGTDTTFGLTYVHQNDDKIPDYGITIVQRPGKLIAMPASEYDVGVERSTFLGFDRDRDRSKVDMLTARFSRQVSDRLTLTSDTRLGGESRYFQYSTTDQCSAACNAALFDGNPATRAFAGMGGSGPYDMDAWGLQNISTARIDWEFGGLRHQTILGLDLSYQSNDKLFFAYTLPAGLTARNQIPRDLVDPSHVFPAGYAVYRPSPTNVCPVAPARACSATAATVLNTSGNSTDAALFLTDRLWFNDALSLIGSVRVDRYKATLDSTTVGGVTTRIKSKSDLVNPRVSLVWEPSEANTFYLSWGRSSVPQGTSIVGTGTALAVASRDLEPEVSESWEAGAKVGLLDDRLTFSGAIFQVEKSNAKQTDPASGFVLAQSGERQRVKGIELGLSGRITDDWTLNAAYAWLDAEILESFTNCAAATLPCLPGQTAGTPRLNTFVIGRQAAFVPKQSASLWTTYDFQALVPGLEAGGGVTYQDELFVGYTVGTTAGVTSLTRIAKAPETVSVDAYVAYETGPYRIALNGYNLADRLNYAQVFSNRGAPSPGRSFILSFGVAF